MIYENIYPAIFIARPNRFLAQVQMDGATIVCHVKNTGRCKELLVPGAKVFVQRANNPHRKTQYDLISVYKGARLINMDSQIPNKVFAEWIRTSGFIKNIERIKPETVYGNSRFDFYIETREEKWLVEVKGVTLEEEGIALFPDAPTERGIKHIHELIRCQEDGYKALIVFLIQMKGIRFFAPNRKTHAAFAEALQTAVCSGVRAMALDCCVTERTIEAESVVEMRL